MQTLEEVIRGIEPIDRDAMEEAWKCWDSLCKPLRGLGWLEEALVQMAGIYRTAHPHPDRRAVIIMGADNGVVKEGVTQTDSSVTIQVLENMGELLSTACVMCQLAGCELIPVNIGALSDGKHPRIRNRVVRHGTGNIAEGPAMTREECIRAILVGVDTIREMKEEGYELIVTGEMGIGNTTTSSAVTAVLLKDIISRGRSNENATHIDACVEAVTGRGAGLSDDGLERKKNAIRCAIAINQPDPADPIDVLEKVGGFALAGLAGVFLGGAAAGLPVVIDGFISLTAALLAARISPGCAAYMIPSHQSKEPGAKLILEALHLEPGLCMDMCLGEGSGAVALLPFLDMAAEIYEHMGTFDDIHVEAYEDFQV